MSVVDIKAILAGFSALNLNPTINKLLSHRDEGVRYIAHALRAIQQDNDRILKALRENPEVTRLSVDSADIADLTVGGNGTPGLLEILSGKPSYTRIGYAGTDTTDVVASIASVNAATINTSAAHGFGVGDIVLHEGCSSIRHNGYFVVATVPTSTSYTVANPPAGTGTGGTATLQWAGIWGKQVAFGADGPLTAPFFSTPAGKLYIGKNGSITLLDLAGTASGFIGVETEAAQVITAATNATPVVVTIAGHGYQNGDTLFIAGATGNTAINGYRLVKNATTDTFEITDLDGVDIAGNGVFAGDATATRYYAGMLAETFAIGESFENFKLRLFADGSLKIKNALITLVTGSNEITIDPANASITVKGSVSLVELLAGAATFKPVSATHPKIEIGVSATSAAITITDQTGLPALGIDDNLGVDQVAEAALENSAEVYHASGNFSHRAARARGDYAAPADVQVGDTVWEQTTYGYKDGAFRLAAAIRSIIDSVGAGIADAKIEITVGGSTVTITSSGQIQASSLTLTTDLAVVDGGTGASTAAGARTNLGVYDTAYVDALEARIAALEAAMAGKSDVGHTHTVSTENVASVPSSHSHTLS